MVKRARLEIIKDILEIIDKSRNGIKSTPLLRKSNLSSLRFKEYFEELKDKRFIIQSIIGNEKKIILTEKGKRFLLKYRTIIEFIDEFEI